jgi:hypothetical protein
MLDIKVERYRCEYFEGVNSLWQEVFPDSPAWNAVNVAIPAKLAVQPELFTVALDGSRVVGSIIGLAVLPTSCFTRLVSALRRIRSSGTDPMRDVILYGKKTGRRSGSFVALSPHVSPPYGHR